jgi:ketosteroid isomerase-like protein
MEEKVSESGSLPMTPRQAFERIQRSTLTMDPAYADLYAEDGVHELPFARPGMPRRIEGRENIRAFLGRAAGAAPMTFKEFRNVRVHETTDPGTIICEYDLHGFVNATGNPFTFSYVLLITVRNGQLALVRDYMDTSAMTAALGSTGGTSS